jgi:DNA-binding NtrC family response regulator
VLQDGRVRPVGTNQERQLNVRIIAATNRNLEAEVSQGRFREDLYFRLETFTINVPSLRDRDEDLELLTAHFINNFNLRMQRNINGINSSALIRLKAHSFPGNVRELSNTVERAVAFCHEREITVADLPERLRKSGKQSGIVEQKPLLPGLLPANGTLPTLAEVEQEYIRLVLNRLEGNKRRAAETLGIGRRTLYRHLDGDNAKEGKTSG